MFYAMEGGGVRTYLTAKARWLRQHTRIHHTVVAPAADGGCYDPVVVDVPSLPIPYVNGYRMPLSTCIATRVLRRLQPDLIEVGDPYQFAWAALRAKNTLDIPVVAFYHSDLPGLIGHRLGSMAKRIATRYAKYLYRQFDLVLAPSKAVEKRLRDMGIEQVRHQPLGVDTSIFSPARRNNQLRTQLGLQKNARLLVYAGRFSREKKLPLLIEAVERLGHPYHLLMIGSGDEVSSSKYVTRFPFQQDACALAGLIASCDLLVHPGGQETFGLTVLEAMACGVPVVGVSAGGVGELIDSDAGILVPPDSAIALAEGIDHIYRCDLDSLGASAHASVLKKYGWEKIFPQLMTHYASLFAVHRRAELEARASFP